MIRQAALGFAIAVVLSGCSTSSPPPASDYCVPPVSVTPAQVRPGETITVEVASGCDAPTPPGGWVVTAAPVGDPDRAARTEIDAELVDGFSVSLELPASFPFGEAWAGIREWNYRGCPDGASCASPTGSFRVVRAP